MIIVQYRFKHWVIVLNKCLSLDIIFGAFCLYMHWFLLNYRSTHRTYIVSYFVIMAGRNELWIEIWYIIEGLIVGWNIWKKVNSLSVRSLLSQEFNSYNLIIFEYYYITKKFLHALLLWMISEVTKYKTHRLLLSVLAV